MSDIAGAPMHGVIVVAEEDVFAAVAASGARWRIQERQPSVDEMWKNLSTGALDKQSRIVVLSDAASNSSEEASFSPIARAVVAMANAGAYVFVVHRFEHHRSVFDAAIAAAATAQGISADSIVFHRANSSLSQAELLDVMREALADVVTFPPLQRQSIDLSDLHSLESLDSTSGAVAAAERLAAPAASIPTQPRPQMPPVGAPMAERVEPANSPYPAQASMELLNRPKLPDQMTITVTSSKGGSGKSTVSILLAATIARASAAAGRPLSVCLLDLDTRDGQVASLIGKFMPTALNIRVQPVWDEERIRRNLVVAQELGVDTLLAPIRPRTADTVGPDFYRAIVRSLQRMYDVVIMDTSVQYLEPLIAEVAFKEADEILFVTTLASTAVQGMARALREMTAPVDESGLGVSREKIGIIVNQSVANVGMERDQVLAAGLGVPVVGVIPLATRDVLTASNLNKMHALLEHPALGPAYGDIAKACLPGRQLEVIHPVATADDVSQTGTSLPPSEEEGRRRGLFRR